MYFHYFVIISSLKAAWSFLCIHLNSLYPRIQRCFVQSLVEIGHVLLEKKMKMLKDLKRQQRRRRRWTTMDNRRILIRKAHFSLWLRWAKYEIMGILPWSPIYYLYISTLDDVYMNYYHINMVKLPSRRNSTYIIKNTIISLIC